MTTCSLQGEGTWRAARKRGTEQGGCGFQTPRLLEGPSKSPVVVGTLSPVVSGHFFVRKHLDWRVQVEGLWPFEVHVDPKEILHPPFQLGGKSMSHWF